MPKLSWMTRPLLEIDASVTTQEKTSEATAKRMQLNHTDLCDTWFPSAPSLRCRITDIRAARMHFGLWRQHDAMRRCGNRFRGDPAII